MRKAVFLLTCLGFVGAAIVDYTSDGWVLRATHAFVALLVASVLMAVIRGLVIRRIIKRGGSIYGDGVEGVTFGLYVIACVLAIAAATAAGAFLPHPGNVMVCAAIGVVLAGLLTARMNF